MQCRLYNNLPSWKKEKCMRTSWKITKFCVAKRDTDQKNCGGKWEAEWKAYQRSYDRNPTTGQTVSPSKKKRLNLDTTVNSLATQMRAEKSGFAQFLHRQRVPAVACPAYDCGWHSQAARHILRQCVFKAAQAANAQGSGHHRL